MFGVRTMPKRLLICMLLLQPLCGLYASQAPLNPTEAARLLQQASFGPTLSDIQATSQMTAEQWIDWQLRLPATTHADKINTLPEQKNAGAAQSARNLVAHRTDRAGPTAATRGFCPVGNSGGVRSRQWPE